MTDESTARIARLEERMRKQEALFGAKIVSKPPRPNQGDPGDIVIVETKVPVLMVRTKKKWLTFAPQED